jgi:hypothetical protein
VNLQHALEDWMEDHEVEMLDLIAEEADRFRAMHPGIEQREERVNALVMANRRFLARALGQVLPAYLEECGLQPPGDKAGG